MVWEGAVFHFKTGSCDGSTINYVRRIREGADKSDQRKGGLSKSEILFS